MEKSQSQKNAKKSKTSRRFRADSRQELFDRNRIDLELKDNKNQEIEPPHLSLKFPHLSMNAQVKQWPNTLGGRAISKHFFRYFSKVIYDDKHLYQQDKPARDLRNHGAESNPNDYSARATQRGFRERLDDLYTEPKNDEITREHRQEVQRKIREMTLSKCTPWLDDLVTPAPQEPIRAPHPTTSAISITRTVGAAASYKPRPTPKDTEKQRQISQKDARNLLIAQKRTGRGKPTGPELNILHEDMGRRYGKKPRIHFNLVKPMATVTTSPSFIYIISDIYTFTSFTFLHHLHLFTHLQHLHLFTRLHLFAFLLV